MLTRGGVFPVRTGRSVASCSECFAWGMTYARGACLACYNFSAARFGHVPGACGACRRRVPLKNGYCRLCWCQAREDRAADATDARSAVVLAPYLPRIRHHQLFLAGMTQRRAPARLSPRRYGAKGRPTKRPPRPVGRPRDVAEQLRLFGDVGDINWRRALVDLRRGPAPDNPWLGWALHLAHTTAENRGWNPASRRAMQRALVVLLSRHQPGDRIAADTVVEVCDELNVGVDLLMEILVAMDVVDDDRPDSFTRWLPTVLYQLAPAIAADAQSWVRNLHDGGPRTPALSPDTARSYLRAARPALLAWSQHYEHLREVTRGDVEAHLAALTGELRHTTATALRSLFGWARRTKIVFTNPTTGIRLGRRERRLWQPLPAQVVTAAAHVVTSPQGRLFLVLAAVHAARPGAVRAMRLRDVDLGARRLVVAGHARPLDQLTHDVVRAWLEHRAQRWPRTANPHLVISKESAMHHGPVGAGFMRELRDVEATLEQIRIDRQLDEALAVGFDPLHLAEVFNTAPETAVRYAVVARALREQSQD